MQTSSLTRRRVLQGGATIAVASLLPALHAEGYGGPQPPPSGSWYKYGLSIPAAKVNTIGPMYMGLSYEKSTLSERLMTASNSGLIALFKLLSNTGILRLGGNSVDRSLWVGTGSGGVSGSIATGDVDVFVGFLKATGWKCLYGINLGGYRSGVQTPDKAVAEVAYVVSKLGIFDAAKNPEGILYAIEIGNEVENYGLSRGPFYNTTPPWNEAKFEAIWNEFQRAILKRMPGVPMTGPTTGQFGVKEYAVPFGEHENATVPNLAALTQHYYTGDAKGTNPPASSAGLLARPDKWLETVLADLNTSIANMGPKAKVPFRITECNSYYNGGAPGVSNTYASTLWVIDFLFTCAQHGAAGVNIHGGGDSSSYVPIADNGKTVDPEAMPGVRPLYYGMLLAALAGQGDLYVCDLGLVPDKGSQVNATAWAVKTSAGWNIIVNNKDAKGNLQIDVTLPDGMKPKSAKLITLTQTTNGDGPTLAATNGVRIQGSAVDSNGTFSRNAAYTLPAKNTFQCFCPVLSAVLIQIAT